MQWDDDAFVLSAKPFGEDGLLIQLLTRSNGRHAGLLRGGQSRKTRAVAEPGSEVRAAWRARLADQLGSFSLDPIASHASHLLDDPGRLAALSSALALLERALPEREAHPACFEGLKALVQQLALDHWAEAYVIFELALLKELGFGLDLTPDGDNEPLVFVSPRTGKAVPRRIGGAFAERLLPLPGFIVGLSEGGLEEVGQGLILTGHFLARHIFHPQDRPLPPARERLAARFSQTK